MKFQKGNASKLLSYLKAPVSLARWLLVLMIATVLGVALRSPMKSFRDPMRATPTFQGKLDPYDLRTEHSGTETRSRLETGL